MKLSYSLSTHALSSPVPILVPSVNLQKLDVHHRAHWYKLVYSLVYNHILFTLLGTLEPVQYHFDSKAEPAGADIPIPQIQFRL